MISVIRLKSVYTVLLLTYYALYTYHEIFMHIVNSIDHDTKAVSLSFNYNTPVASYTVFKLDDKCPYQLAISEPHITLNWQAILSFHMDTCSVRSFQMSLLMIFS